MGHGKKILVVDDEDLLLRIERAFERHASAATPPSGPACKVLHDPHVPARPCLNVTTPALKNADGNCQSGAEIHADP